MAEALRAGAQQLIVPFSADQPFWANRLHRLGYALQPVREERLNADALVAAFDEMARPERAQKAAHLRERLVREDGCGAAAAYIERLTGL